MRVLDLFSGLMGWSQPFADRGHEVFTVDIEPKFEPDLAKDMMDVTVEDIPWVSPDVILASPPCEAFSVASIGTHWGGGHRGYEPKTQHAVRNLHLVRGTLQLIDWFRPSFWVIENPRGMLRKLPTPLLHHERVTVTYCQYGERRRKPTDLWGGFPPSWAPNPPCVNGQPCHDAAPRGAKTGTQGLDGSPDRAKVPYELGLEVCRAAEMDLEAGRRWEVRRLLPA